MIAAGIPAVGLTGNVPAEFGDLHYQLWHDPDDTTEHQSAETLGAAGRVAEAFIRQLLAMDEFPREMGPYIYFEDSNQTLGGWPLWAIFVGFVALFFIASLITLPKRSWREAFESRKRAAAHLLSLWLPLLASIVLTYGLVAAGIMDEYAAYPATSKDAHIYNPRWLAVIIFLAVFFSTRMARKKGLPVWTNTSQYLLVDLAIPLGRSLVQRGETLPQPTPLPVEDVDRLLETTHGLGPARQACLGRFEQLQGHPLGITALLEVSLGCVVERAGPGQGRPRPFRRNPGRLEHGGAGPVGVGDLDPADGHQVAFRGHRPQLGVTSDQRPGRGPSLHQ